MDVMEGNTDGKVAVVGLDCRFPGARGAGQYWELLSRGGDAVRTLDEEELRRVGVPRERFGDPDYVRRAATIEGAGDFDASFFYLSGREAERMDPQLRVFLECTWAALEDSGHNSEGYEGRIGVYAGGLGNTYQLANLLTGERGYRGSILDLREDLAGMMGNDVNYLATRVAYHLNLTGPSVVVQAACSTSLLAIHTAAQALTAGECDVAIAGGVSIRFPQEAGYLHQPDGVESPEGICRPFDAAANGTIFGNGAGAVVLKRLSDALAEGDTILAVIAGSATGNDGADRVGYTAPGERGQAAVLGEALGVTGLKADDVQYVEAHGTGTAMGDPIEFRAIDAVYGRRTTPCMIGSVKGNVGHLSIAAGVAGFIKCVLMLRHRQFVPTLHFTRWNPECGAEGTPFEVITRTSAWNVPGGGPRRCAVTAAGMGGATAHVVLEEAPVTVVESEAESEPEAPTILPLSAKSPAALEVARRNLARHLSEHDVPLTDVRHTLATGRRTFDYRTAVIAVDRESAVQALESGSGPNVVHDSGHPRERPVFFMFPGQGAQYAGMGAAWYGRLPVFTTSFDECAQTLRPLIGLDLRAALFTGSDDARGPDLARTRLTQPAMFAVTYALSRQWMAWGLEPSGLIGHSIGEYVAACLAGVFTLPDALRIVARRGALVEELPTGSMAAVLVPAAEVAGLLPPEVGVAAVNEASACTISGPAAAVRAAVVALSATGLTVRKIRTSHAFHSAMMEPAMAELEKTIAAVDLSVPRIPFVSNVTGTWITDAEATDAGYWARHLRAPVLFESGVRTMLSEPDPVFLEVGPGQTLSSFVRRNPDRETGVPVLSSTGRSHEGDADARAVLTAYARLWCAGLPMSWERLGTGRRLPLPTYPFESRRYWVEPGDAQVGVITAGPGKLAIGEWLWAPVWRRQQVSLDYQPDDAPAREVVLLFEPPRQPLSLVGPLAAGHPDTQVVVVRAGESCGLPGDGIAGSVRPGSEADFSALVGHLGRQGTLPTRVVLAWSLGRPDGDGAEVLAQEQDLGLHSVIALVKALTEHDVTQAIRLDLVTAGAYTVLDEDPDAVVERVALEVAAKVVGQEQSNLEVRHYDLPRDDDPASLRTLAGLLTGPSGPEPGYAIRAGRRFVRDFERVRADWNRPRRAPFRTDGTYLITGGLGEIGATLARMLQAECRARLGLVVRGPLPPRTDWDGLLATAAQRGLTDLDAESREQVLRIRRLQELEATGLPVVVVAANVAAPVELERAFREVETHLGAVNGVVHAAGRPSEQWDRAVTAASAEQCGWHFEAKAYGSIALEEVLRSRPVDFCLLMSSLAGVLGGLRLLAYGAANRFMDAVAERANRHGGGPWVSVGWDVWQHHQDEKRAISAIGRVMDDKAIQPEEGLEIARRVLCLSGAGPLSASTWDLQHRLDTWTRAAGSAQEEDRGGGEPANRGQGAGGIGAQVLGVVRDALGAPDMSAADDIFEQGGDSLLVVRLLSDIRRTFDVQIPLAAALDEPTAAHLADLVEARRRRRDESGPQPGPERDVLGAMLERLPAEEVETLFDMVIWETAASTVEGTGR
jgi:acyl transferase domain-containing protein/acyl carrier protein